MAGTFSLSLVCPYCGYEDPDAWEVPDGEGTREYAYETDRYFTTHETGGGE